MVLKSKTTDFTTTEAAHITAIFFYLYCYKQYFGVVGLHGAPPGRRAGVHA